MTQLGSPDVQPASGPPLTPDERVELERLRLEVGAMRAERRDQRRGRSKVRWRSVLAVLLIVVGCVLTPVAGLAVWTNNQVSNTDRFVRTMGPLVDDPDVQNAVTDRVTATVFQYVDVQGLADQAVAALVAQGLPAQLGERLDTLTPTLASSVQGFVRGKVGEVVASPAFASAWNQVIRVAHSQLVTILSGNSQSVVIRNGSVFLDLAPFIDLAKQRLSDAGLTVVNQIPEVHPTVKVANATTLVRAQGAYKTLDTVASVLPWIVLLLFAVGVYLARNRFRALVGTGLGIALAMVVLAAALLVARSVLVGEVPAAAAPATASGYDILVHYLRVGLRAVLVLGLVMAAAGFLAGRSDTAVGIRRWTAAQLHRIRGSRTAAGPVATWVRRHIRGLRIGAVALAVLVFVFLTQPTGAAILVIAVILLIVLAVIEFLAGPAPVAAPAEPPPVAGPAEPPPSPRPAPEDADSRLVG